MNISQLKENLAANSESITPDEAQLPKSLRTLFELYAQTEASHLEKSGAEGLALEELSETLSETQDTLINLSAKLSANTLEDIMFKIALWRRHAAEIDPFDTCMTGDEKLGYSAFVDLAVMCERDEVFTKRDRQFLFSH